MKTENIYCVLIQKRVVIAGELRTPGALVAIAPDRLRVAVHLCSTGCARPANAYTERAVELFHLLQLAIPPLAKETTP